MSAAFITLKWEIERKKVKKKFLIDVHTHSLTSFYIHPCSLIQYKKWCTNKVHQACFNQLLSRFYFVGTKTSLRKQYFFINVVPLLKISFLTTFYGLYFSLFFCTHLITGLKTCFSNSVKFDPIFMLL